MRVVSSLTAQMDMVRPGVQRLAASLSFPTTATTTTTTTNGINRSKTRRFLRPRAQLQVNWMDGLGYYFFIMVCIRVNPDPG